MKIREDEESMLAILYFRKVAYYSLSNPKEQIGTYIEDVVRRTIPLMTLEKIFLEKGEIQKVMFDELDDEILG